MANRCKRDYEDLDNTYGIPVESVQRYYHGGIFGSPPIFFQSDSAINAIKQTDFQPMKRGHANSVPFFIQSDLTSSFQVLPKRDPENNITQNQTTLSRYSLRRRENFYLLVYVCLYATYLLIGTFCIAKIEAPIELALRKNYTEMRDKFLQQYPQIADELEIFVKFVIAANDIGIIITEDYDNETNWNFGQSFFFSTSLVTTIGYGHITPKSFQGKLFCIVFSAIGIPLTLALFNAMVHRLHTPTEYLLKLLVKKINPSRNLLSIRIAHLLIIGLLVLIIFFGIPMSILLYLEEKWTVLDSFYFCFISLTTIGLGDFIPGEAKKNEYESLYKVIISIYLIVGLIAMMLLLTVFYSIPQFNIGVLFMDSDNSEKNKEKSVTCNVPDCCRPRTSSLPS